jgi:hypothetical protein
METRSILGLTLVLGVVGGFLIVSLGMSVIAPSSSTPNPDSEATLSYTTATGCADGPVPSAWIGNVPLDNSVLVVFNETYTHEAAAIDVNATLESSSDNDYILRITTGTASEMSERKGDPPTGCQPKTTVEMSINLP